MTAASTLSKATALLHSTIADTIRYLLPSFCRLCGEKLSDERFYCVCEACWGKIPLLEAPLCGLCGRPLARSVVMPGERGLLCRECRRRKPHFDAVRAVGFYRGALKDIIHLYKFAGRYHLHRPLARLMLAELAGGALPEGFGLVMAAPLSPYRLRERGYDQGELLALEISRALGLEMSRGNLRKKTARPPQSVLSRDERMRNVRGNYYLKRPGAVKGKRVLFVDDIFTTGATASECAAVLKKAGATVVYVFTLARGE